MKKFALILLVAVLCVPIFAFAACAEPDDPYDLSTKEIGYEIPVYPDCEFSYVVKWEEWDPETREDIEKSCTVKITDMKAILIEKNSISQGDTLENDYYPYIIKITIEGQTDVAFAGLKVTCYVRGDNSSSSLLNSTVDNDGKIRWENNLGYDYLSGLSFSGLYTSGNFQY